jgi:hypothetical protein
MFWFIQFFPQYKSDIIISKLRQNTNYASNKQKNLFTISEQLEKTMLENFAKVNC